uniref:Cytochrome b6-f complex subunit 6 n=2 Tax=Liagora TaxID=31487 RepID=A0A1G4NZX2_9FLOR|nr:Cytochrome b6-f complex subunit 6 [Liagora harveyana]YP_009315526.1 Cytochrome b6-f complex subunit 6 [Liagora brachyclada]SCW22552.1 Cytochrome b6-f complex subunit 6 [Liagora harveyana]SCW24184.1 Cytochrome b6-f complex subunit 6 [Liagora brachyclada]
MSIFISYILFLSVFMGLAIGLFFSLQSIKLI